MPRFSAPKRLTEGLTAAGLLVCALALVRHPREISAAVRQGLELCGTVILPALFPFFVLTSLAVSLGLPRLMSRVLEPVMKPLFRLSGSCAAPLALGLIGGYPVGAKAALTLYQSDQCSKSEAERLLAFCNNAGPSFILGVVGAQIFADSRAGMLLWLTHITAALCVGLLVRFTSGAEGSDLRRQGPPFSAVSLPAAFTKAVGDGLHSTLNLCAFVVCFTAILRLCQLTGLISTLAGLLGCLGLPRYRTEQLLTGLLELSSGTAALRDAGDLEVSLALAAFFLGWAGLSVHCQTLSLLQGSGLRYKFYWLGKLLQGLIAAVLTVLLYRFFPFSCPAGSWPVPPLIMPARFDWITLTAWGLVLTAALGCIKKSGKSWRPMV